MGNYTLTDKAQACTNNVIINWTCLYSLNTPE